MKPMKGFISRYTEKTLSARLSIRFILQSWEYVILEEIQHELLEAPETTYNFEVEGGNLSLPNWAKIAIGVATIGIGVIATAATGGLATPALIAGVKTALVVGTISAGTSAATTALSSILNGDNIKTTAKKMMTSAVDGFCDGFMTGGIMAGASMTYGSLLKNANGIKLGTTDKPQYGRANIGYGNPKTNGNTIISIQNKAGKSVFRLEADAINMLHMHYGKTKAAMALHRTGIIQTIVGVISGAN